LGFGSRRIHYYILLCYGKMLNPHEKSVGGGAGFEDVVLWTWLAGV
jgi:hypothetical protein